MIRSLLCALRPCFDRVPLLECLKVYITLCLQASNHEMPALLQRKEARDLTKIAEKDWEIE